MFLVGEKDRMEYFYHRCKARIFIINIKVNLKDEPNKIRGCH